MLKLSTTTDNCHRDKSLRLAQKNVKSEYHQQWNLLKWTQIFSFLFFVECEKGFVYLDNIWVGKEFVQRLQVPSKRKCIHKEVSRSCWDLSWRLLISKWAQYNEKSSIHWVNWFQHLEILGICITVKPNLAPKLDCTIHMYQNQRKTEEEGGYNFYFTFYMKTLRANTRCGKCYKMKVIWKFNFPFLTQRKPSQEENK